MMSRLSRRRLDWKAWSFWLAGFALALSAFLLRSHQLEARPIHGDEAVQGYLLGTMLKGEYEFYPHEYHGPLLHNLATPLAWLRGETPTTESQAGWENLHLRTLRLVPALCTSALCLAPLLLWPWLTRFGALSASFLLAVNTMLIYFGRHYIAEGLLVTCLSFCFVFAWRAVAAYCSEQSQKQAKYWAMLASLCLACAWGTKATFLIQLAAALLALKLLAWLACLNPRFRSWFQPRAVWSTLRQKATLTLLLCSTLSLLAAWLLIYSQAGQDPQAPLKSITTYTTYAERTQGEGHEKPFGFYAQTLFGDPYGLPPKPEQLSWGDYFNGYIKHPRLKWIDYWDIALGEPGRLRPIQSEAPLAILAILGLIVSWLPKSLWLTRNRPHPWLVSWFFLSAILLLLLYSLIPYKTIWSVLGVPVLLCFPAAIGFYWLAQWPLTLWKLKTPQTFGRWLLRSLLFLSLYTLILFPSAYVAINWRAQICWQNYPYKKDNRSVDLNSVDPSNPWVYSQTPTAFERLPAQLQKLAQNTAAKAAPAPDARIQVLCLSHNAPWPLPWYYRKQTSPPVNIGYFSQAAELPLLENRQLFRAQFAALIADNSHLGEMSQIAATKGYRQALFVQYYQHAHLMLWIRDDLFGQPEPSQSQAPPHSAPASEAVQATEPAKPAKPSEAPQPSKPSQAAQPSEATPPNSTSP